MRGHHEATGAAAQMLGYLAPLLGAVGARIVLAVKEWHKGRDK